MVDNGSVNGTMIERRGGRDTVGGRLRLRDKDEVLILGYLIDDERPTVIRSSTSGCPWRVPSGDETTILGTDSLAT